MRWSEGDGGSSGGVESWGGVGAKAGRGFPLVNNKFVQEPVIIFNG